MKSARMLLTTTGLFALVVATSGCTRPGWGISPPLTRAEPEPAPGTVGEQPVVSAAATRPAPHSLEEDTTDPSVAELARTIEAMADRTATQPAAEFWPATQPSVATIASATTQPAMPTTPPSPPTTAPAPLQIASAAPPVAPAHQDTTSTTDVAPATAATTTRPAEPMVANAPTADRREAHSETTASPAPRHIPLIQPTPPRPVATAEITDIRAVLSPVSPDAASTPAAANQPAQADQQPRTADLEMLIERAEQNLQQKPPHPQDELQLRLLYLAANMDDRSNQPVRGMDPIQSELLTAIVKVIASSRQAMLEPNNATPSALAAADDLRRLLGQQSGVTIPRVALVTKVASYGDYDVITPLRFKAGNEIHAYVYTEIANFRCEPVDGERLRTVVAERVQVFDAAGKVVWERYENNIEDRTRTPRRDFFIPFPLKLPATLATGDYVLKVTVEDRLGGTTDQQRLSFSIQ